MGLEGRLEHVAIAVEDLDAAMAVYSAVLGRPASGRETVESEQVRIAFFDVGETRLELLEPTASDADKAFINELLTADLGVLPQWRKDPQKLWTIDNDLLTKVLSTEDSLTAIMGEAQSAADAVMSA